MSLVEEILRELWNTSLSYKGAKGNLFGVPIFKSHLHGSTRNYTFSPRKKGFINWGIKVGILLLPVKDI